MTKQAKNVTDKRDASRARTPSSGGYVTDVTLPTDVTANRDVTVVMRDSDKASSPSGRPRHGHEKRLMSDQPKTSWMHIAAMNLIADAKAGIKVDPEKLAMAVRVLGRGAAP